YNSGVNRGRIRFAAQGPEQAWHTRQARKSARFTSNWNELLRVNI
ncbi:MAG: DUF4113 domain-containing protein, partial [Candidatus Moranbacteria bacterium]|nr:DUF4113 domain-containing protein [Candidatus Moranbacteria bacterium]